MGPPELYLEDFQAGTQIRLAEADVSHDEIVAFARRFDPQPFHVDEEAARETPFGGLVASGWHTCSIFMRLWVDAMIKRTASLGGLGVDEVRTPHPVRPGDTLTGTVEVVVARRSERKPDRGTVTWRGELRNQEDVVVLSLICHGRVACRSACGGAL